MGPSTLVAAGKSLMKRSESYRFSSAQTLLGDKDRR